MFQMGKMYLLRSPAQDQLVSFTTSSNRHKSVDVCQSVPLFDGFKGKPKGTSPFWRVPYKKTRPSVSGLNLAN